MKKIILFLIITVTLFSCGNNAPITKPNQFIQKSNMGDNVSDINKFEHNGHTFLQFGSGTASSVVHDPDCKCKK